MQLPAELRARIEEMTADVPQGQLRKAAEHLSASYRRAGSAFHLDTPAKRLAYLQVRLPATYAACVTAMRYAKEVMAGFAPESMLDLGSGPGTAMLAGKEVFPSLRHFIAIERDRELASMAASLARFTIEQRTSDVATSEFPAADIVMASYSFNEVPAVARAAFLDRALQAAKRLFIVMEPGTPEGYRNIIDIRERLLAAGGVIVAPCPHHERCPMRGTSDWCHFAARVERSSLHRQLKGGELGHEDEKYSYVAFARQTLQRPAARIVRHPRVHSGHVKLDLCVDCKEIRRATVTRSQNDDYKRARRARWGDAWPRSYTDGDEE